MEVALTSGGCSVLSSLALCASTDCKPINSCCSFSLEDVSNMSYKNMADNPASIPASSRRFVKLELQGYFG